MVATLETISQSVTDNLQGKNIAIIPLIGSWRWKGERIDMVSLDNLLLLKSLQSFRSEETSMSFVCKRSGTLLLSWSLGFLL